ncbi:MAG: cell division protein FtsW [Kiritimatiellae bacterium]|nr:cell division protein FtsW [Kiritimatiellia bacterium]
MYKTLNFLGIVVLSLVVVGIVVLASAGEQNGLRLYQDASFFLKRQAMWLGVAFLFLLVSAFFDYHRWREWPWLTIAFYLIVVILMVSVFAFPATKGSHRWIRLGSIRMQPSELAKILVVISSAVLLDRIGWRIERFWKGALPAVGVAAVLMGLAVAEPDFGATMVIALTAGILFLIAGMRIKHMGLMGLVGACGVGTLLAFNANRMNRIAAWLPSWMASAMGVSPEAMAVNAEKDASYQLTHALEAIRRGGVFGMGFSRSEEKLGYLPEAHTDFIFAIGAEEWGLFFSIALLLLFVVFFVCGMIIAAHAPDRLGRLLAYGMTFLIFFQAMFNLGVVTGCLPTKGLALPFISYGGTNLITAMVAVGTLFNVGRQIDLPLARTNGAFAASAFRTGMA